MVGNPYTASKSFYTIVCTFAWRRSGDPPRGAGAAGPGARAAGRGLPDPLASLRVPVRVPSEQKPAPLRRGRRSGGAESVNAPAGGPGRGAGVPSAPPLGRGGSGNRAPTIGPSSVRIGKTHSHKRTCLRSQRNPHGAACSLQKPRGGPGGRASRGRQVVTPALVLVQVHGAQRGRRLEEGPLGQRRPQRAQLLVHRAELRLVPAKGGVVRRRGQGGKVAGGAWPGRGRSPEGRQRSPTEMQEVWGGHARGPGEDASESRNGSRG